jgi:ribose transport system ATP-binding protein
MLGRDVAQVEKSATAFGGRSVHIGAVALEASHLNAGHKVRDVSFSVRKGEIVGFAGLLGSGRTETARLVFGADPARSGALSLEGASFAPRQPEDAIQRGVGFASEDRKLEGIIPDMSVAENLTLALLPQLTRAGVIDAAKQRAIVLKFIASLGVKCASPDQPIRELSGGNQQKVLLARWLAMGSKLLILDEPTRGIDVGAKAEIQRIIKQLAEDGLSVLMISSELEEVIEGSDRVFVLRDGRSVAELPHSAASEAAVMAAMAHGGAPSGEEGRAA